MFQVQHPNIVQLSEPQNALVNKISAGQDAVDKALKELDNRPSFPNLGNDPVSLVETCLKENKICRA